MRVVQAAPRKRTAAVAQSPRTSEVRGYCPRATTSSSAWQQRQQQLEEEEGLKGTDLVEEHQEGKEDATKISTSGIPSGAAQRTAAGAQSPRMAAAAVTVAAGGGGGHEGYGPCRGGQGGRGGHHKDLS